jgi:hypothetical protein
LGVDAEPFSEKIGALREDVEGFWSDGRTGTADEREFTQIEEDQAMD